MKDNLILLVGPTSIGKTGLSIEIARDLSGEIISADSMQIYKYMDIGTAKVTRGEMKNIPHHLIDIVYPDEGFTVSDYEFEAKNKIVSITKEGKIPIVVGGTGLYINSLVYDLNFSKAPPNYHIRNKYEALAHEQGIVYVYEKLYSIDKNSAIKIGKSDLKRLIRAIEIYETTGVPMSKSGTDFRKKSLDYNYIMICLNMERSKLYDRINKRVDLMIKNGLVNEVKNLIDLGYTKDLVSMQGIGYKEIISYLEGRITLLEAINMIKQGSRNYAKRQLTWFRRDDRVKWIDVDEFPNQNDLILFTKNYILSSFENQ